MTHEQLAEKPDISLLPVLADDFGVSIDELMDFKLNVYTNKERLSNLCLRTMF